MKQLMVRLAAALSVVAMLGLTGSAAHAQKPAGGAPQGAPSEADQKAMMEFQKKAQAIQAKYKPQLDALQKKYKPELDKVQAKYKPQLEAIQKEGQGLKPEEKQGPKAKALMDKAAGIQKQMAAEPAVKKMMGELKPILKKVGDEVLLVAPPKMKPMIKQQIEAQIKQMSG